MKTIEPDIESTLGDERDEEDRLEEGLDTPSVSLPALDTDAWPGIFEQFQPSLLRIAAVNRLMQADGRSDEAIPDCRIVIADQEVTTDRTGTATLDLSRLPDGNLMVTAATVDTIDAEPGPGVPAETSRERAWAPYEALLEKSGGTVRPGQGGQPIKVEGDRVVLSLTPLWMRARGQSARRGGPIDLIMMHHTGSNNRRADLNTLVFSGTVSAHYLITPDGTVVKLVDEGQKAWHAGHTDWQGDEQLNGRSIGIEITHATGRDYEAAQIDAALSLVEKLFAAFPSILAERLIAHSDAAVNRPQNRPPKRHGRKSTDPGSAFPWELFEARGWGLMPVPGSLPEAAYGGFFEGFPEGSLRSGDSDRRQRYDGVHRPSISGAVAELQTDLKEIGYHVGSVDGAFGAITHWALQMFQQHLFSGSRRLHPENSGDGRCDQATALMIKRVLGKARPPLIG